VRRALVLALLDPRGAAVRAQLALRRGDAGQRAGEGGDGGDEECREGGASQAWAVGLVRHA
jgi:hypothetical protein